MKILRVVIGVCSVMLVLASTARAQEPAQATAPAPEKICGLCNAAESDGYLTQVGGKLGRGLANGLLGWTELFVQPVKASHAHEGLAVGIDRGIGNMLKRTVVGIGEFFTCWTWPGTPVWAKDCSLGVMGMTGR